MAISSNVQPVRAAIPRISIFNHKGGVGKSTLTVNVAMALAELGLRVLLVDSDPQCNLTSYLVEDSVVNDLLDNSDSPSGRTIWSALKPVVEATGDALAFTPIEVQDKLMLVPGDLRLAEFEAELSTFWGECYQRKIKGFRGTSALSALVNEAAVSVKADLIFYDTGPNIGPLNRVILLDCDYFMVPAACDLFSVRAIKTLGRTLSAWISDWKTVEALAPEGVYAVPGMPKALGYIPQGFRTYAGTPTNAFAELIPKLEKSFTEDLLTVLGRVDEALVSKARAPLSLAAVKDFGGLATAAQTEGVAIWRTHGGSAELKEEARACFHGLARILIARIRAPE